MANLDDVRGDVQRLLDVHKELLVYSGAQETRFQLLLAKLGQRPIQKSVGTQTDHQPAQKHASTQSNITFPPKLFVLPPNNGRDLSLEEEDNAEPRLLAASRPAYSRPEAGRPGQNRAESYRSRPSRPETYQLGPSRLSYSRPAPLFTPEGYHRPSNDDKHTAVFVNPPPGGERPDFPPYRSTPIGYYDTSNDPDQRYGGARVYRRFPEELSPSNPPYNKYFKVLKPGTIRSQPLIRFAEEPPPQKSILDESFLIDSRLPTPLPMLDAPPSKPGQAATRSCVTLPSTELAALDINASLVVSRPSRPPTPSPALASTYDALRKSPEDIDSN